MKRIDFDWNLKEIRKALRISLIKWNFNLIFSDLMDFSKSINSYIITRDCGFCKNAIKKGNFCKNEYIDIFFDKFEKCEYCYHKVNEICEYIDDYDVNFLYDKGSYVRGCKEVIKRLIKIKKEVDKEK